MQTIQQVSNPFALMIDPQSVLNAMDCSGRLSRLRSEIFRPLDKPLLARLPANVLAFDDEIDHEADLPEADD